MEGSRSNVFLQGNANAKPFTKADKEKIVDYSKEPLFFKIPSVQQVPSAVRPVVSTPTTSRRRIREPGVFAPDLTLERPPSPIRVVIDIRDKRERDGCKGNEELAALPPRGGRFSLRGSCDGQTPPQRTRQAFSAQIKVRRVSRECFGNGATHHNQDLVDAAVAAVATAADNKNVDPRFTGGALVLRSPRQTRTALLRREFVARTFEGIALAGRLRTRCKSRTARKRPSTKPEENSVAAACERSTYNDARRSQRTKTMWMRLSLCPCQEARGIGPAGPPALPHVWRGLASSLSAAYFAIERNRECDDQAKVAHGFVRSIRSPVPSSCTRIPTKKNTRGAAGRPTSDAPFHSGVCGFADFRGFQRSAEPNQAAVANESLGLSGAQWPTAFRTRQPSTPSEATSSIKSIDQGECGYDKCLLREATPRNVPCANTDENILEQGHELPSCEETCASVGYVNSNELNAFKASISHEIGRLAEDNQFERGEIKMDVPDSRCQSSFQSPHTKSNAQQQDASSIAFEPVMETDTSGKGVVPILQTADAVESPAKSNTQQQDASSIAFEPMMETDTSGKDVVPILQTADAVVSPAKSNTQQQDASSIAFEPMMETDTSGKGAVPTVRRIRTFTASGNEVKRPCVHSTFPFESFSNTAVRSNAVGRGVVGSDIMEALEGSERGTGGLGDLVCSLSPDTFTGESSLTPCSLRSCCDGEEYSLQPFLRSMTLPLSARKSLCACLPTISNSDKPLSDTKFTLEGDRDACVISTRSSSPRLWTPGMVHFRGGDTLMVENYFVGGGRKRSSSATTSSTLSVYVAFRNGIHLGLMRRYFCTWKGVSKRRETGRPPVTRRVHITCKGAVDEALCGMVPTATVVASVAAAATAVAVSRLQQITNPHAEPAKIGRLTVGRVRLLEGGGLHHADNHCDSSRGKPQQLRRPHYRMVPPEEDGYLSSSSRHRSICSAETSFSCPSDDVATAISIV